MITFGWLRAFACAAIASSICAAAPPVWAAQAYVSLSGPGGSISVFRPAGGAATQSFATPKGASDVLLSPDGSTLYVGTTSLAIADIQRGAPSLVAVMNPLTGAVAAQFPMPASVFKMAVDATASMLYATGNDSSTGAPVVMSLDLHTGQTALATVPGTNAFSLYPIALSRDGGTLYVPVTNAIAIFNAHTLALVGSIALPSNGIVAPPATTLDGSTLLATGAAQVYVIDLASRTLVKSIPIASSAAAFGSAMSPDGTTFYVNAGTLSVIDVPTLSVKASLALGQANPYRLGLSPDGSTLWATDLTYARTAIVDTATLTVTHTVQSIAPPFAVAVLPGGQGLLLNENGNAMALVDAQALSVKGGFPVGDAPTAPVLASGKLFVPEVANLAVQDRPLAPRPAKPVNVGFIITDTAASLGGKVYANEGSLVRVVSPALDKTTGSLTLRTGGGGVGTALQIAASGDGHTLLASYVVLQIDGGPIDAGLIQVDTTTGTQKLVHSLPFVPNVIASNRAGTFAYGIGFYSPAAIGMWDTANGSFVKGAAMPGSPSYVALATSADGTRLLLVDQHGKVDIADATSLQLLASVAVGSSPSGIAVSADGTRALVTDAKSNSATVLDLVTPGVVGTIDLGAPSMGAVFLD